jgi:UDP-glucose:(heptosyl)LPS alpha-1,3-glucosyltransferase
MAARLGLKDHVHFLGFYPEIRDAYWSSDFFVQPTYYDPCSLVVLEALACGLPVITTEQNGAGELMTDGQEGFVLTAPGAEAELIAALDRMTDDRSRRAMATAARALGRQQTFDLHVERLVAVFEQAAKGKTARSPHTGKWNAQAALGPHAGRKKRSRVSGG